jgi:hypothetical protein
VTAIVFVGTLQGNNDSNVIALFSLRERVVTFVVARALFDRCRDTWLVSSATKRCGSSHSSHQRECHASDRSDPIFYRRGTVLSYHQGS